MIDALALSGADGDEHAHEGEEHAHEGDEHGHGGAGEANPHAWYNPAAVSAVAEAVTKELSELAPDVADYFDEQHTTFETSLEPYFGTIDSIKASATGKTYAATESVFDDMAAALGLTNRTLTATRPRAPTRPTRRPPTSTPSCACSATRASTC